MNCQCGQVIQAPPDHPVLVQEISYLEQLKAQVMKMSLQRAKHEGIDKDKELRNPQHKYYNDLQGYAMD